MRCRMKYDDLVFAAKEAMMSAYAPYSSFFVGAALKGKSGKIYSGCNVENSSYGCTICAERTAITKAVSEGEREFEAIAICGGKNGEITDFCPPCGICRQFLGEFCREDFKIVLVSSNDVKIFTLSEVLPFSFMLKD